MRHRRIVIPRFVTLKMQEELVKVGIYDVELDRVIDSLRIRHNIHIYNTAPPFVSPIDGFIQYGYRIKRCSKHWGWNARVSIGETYWYRNIYDAKRAAIRIATKWILNHMIKVSKKRRKNGTDKKQN